MEEYLNYVKKLIAPYFYGTSPIPGGTGVSRKVDTKSTKPTERELAFTRFCPCTRTCGILPNGKVGTLPTPPGNSGIPRRPLFCCCVSDCFCPCPCTCTCPCSCKDKGTGKKLSK